MKNGAVLISGLFFSAIFIFSSFRPEKDFEGQFRVYKIVVLNPSDYSLKQTYYSQVINLADYNPELSDSNFRSLVSGHFVCMVMGGRRSSNDYIIMTACVVNEKNRFIADRLRRKLMQIDIEKSQAPIKCFAFSALTTLCD